MTGSVYADKVQQEATATLGKAEAPTVTQSSEPCSKSNSTMGQAAEELGATDGDCTETKSEQGEGFYLFLKSLHFHPKQLRAK